MNVCAFAIMNCRVNENVYWIDTLWERTEGVVCTLIRNMNIWWYARFRMVIPLFSPTNCHYVFRWIISSKVLYFSAISPHRTMTFWQSEYFLILKMQKKIKKIVKTFFCTFQTKTNKKRNRSFDPFFLAHWGVL